MTKAEKKITLSKEEEKSLNDLNMRHVYVLVQENQQRGMIYHGLTNQPVKEQKYKPYRNVLLQSSIIWKGGDGFPAGRRILRYYDGCTTIFADQQPQDKETIDKLIANTRQLAFDKGELVVYGYDDMLVQYLDMCSYNAESKHRINKIEAIFRPVDVEKIGEEENEKLDALETALRYAKDNPYQKMVIHANYLGISEIDLQTQNKLTEKSLRSLYRKKASENPELFINSYTNKSIETKYWIEKSIESGVISTTKIPNMACWGSQGTPICDLSGIKDHFAIVTKLVEFSQLAEGEDFLLQLQSLYK